MLTASIKQFKYYKQLVDKALSQIEDTYLFAKENDNDNSIAVIIQHLSGNMKSRWTNIFTEDGEKKWRNRDTEFEESLMQREELISLWESGWHVLFHTLENLTDDDLVKIVYIRNEGLSVQDAILRQLCHYSYHCGQIVIKCKIYNNGNWLSLSIPKNESQQFNSKKFEEPKQEKHFLDSLLDPTS